MLTGIRFNHTNENEDDKYSRNIKVDIKKAMDLLLDFKEELEKLHPLAAIVIERVLQNDIKRY